MRKQKQDNESVKDKRENLSGIFEKLKELDGEEFILTIPITEEESGHEHGESV